MYVCGAYSRKNSRKNSIFIIARNINKISTREEKKTSFFSLLSFPFSVGNTSESIRSPLKNKLIKN